MRYKATFKNPKEPNLVGKPCTFYTEWFESVSLRGARTKAVNFIKRFCKFPLWYTSRDVYRLVIIEIEEDLV